MTLPFILVVIGPTASSKTKIAIELAKKFNGEIINADAFQIYKELNIGTAKATNEETKQAIFHLNGERSIYEKWDINEFLIEAKKIVHNILSKNKMPILVGGSNLYIDALINNYDLSKVKERSNKYDSCSNDELYNMLLNLNKDKALEIGTNNRQRLLRAVEIVNTGGDFKSRHAKAYQPIYIMNNLSREEIYQKINKRVEKMLELGWVDEVENLYIKDKNIDQLNAFKAIGYKTILNSLICHTKLNIDEIKQATRNYAKQQLTWIRHHYENIIFYDDEVFSKISAILTT
ncbi:MAG: tRNA (adenosine(37)-N6)-dimethylallyltransferase MiaA [Mycoplasmataceae bacterium]|nr:tRNA (adenosine(37)-N6)-dimethylallyltransferase MiaA [Mycoplasmataceae bacterium]